MPEASANDYVKRFCKLVNFGGSRCCEMADYICRLPAFSGKANGEDGITGTGAADME